MAICPAGHTSAADDFCDNCGLLIGAPSQAQPVDAWGTARPGGQEGFGLRDSPAGASGTAGAGVAAGGCPNCGTTRTGRFCEGCGLDYNSGKLPGGGPPQSPPTVFAPPAPDPSWGSSFAQQQQQQPPSAPQNAPDSYGSYQPTELSHPVSAGPPLPDPGTVPSAWDPFGQPPPAQQGPDPYDMHPPTQLAPSSFGQQQPAAPQNAPDSYSAAQAGPPAPAAPYVQPDPSVPPSWGAPADPQAPFGQQAGFDPQYQSGPLQPPGYPGPAAPPAWGSGPAGGTWSAIVSADHAYYDIVRRVSGAGAEGIDFPMYAAERRFNLVGAQMRIGRHSATRGLYPEIDLSGPPTDPGISRLHAVLIARPDGGWAVLDPGSANGTMVNGAEIPVNQQVPLRHGDRINLGAWTAITVQNA
jgi:hypothetical protein